MDWQKVIGEIIAAGMSQADVARAVGLKQPTVSALASGKAKDTRSVYAKRFEALHKKVTSDAKRRAAKVPA